MGSRAFHPYRGVEETIEDLRLALLAFKRYNEQWMLAKYDYRVQKCRDFFWTAAEVITVKPLQEPWDATADRLSTTDDLFVTIHLMVLADSGGERPASRCKNTWASSLRFPKWDAAPHGGRVDEILHAARLSPFALTQKLQRAEVVRLFAAARETLTRWLTQLRAEVGDGFPEKVTAFRPGMAVHGRYHRPCPMCGSPVQRIVYGANEANYCAECQTGGKVLADRALSRLLKQDWPRTLR